MPDNSEELKCCPLCGKEAEISYDELDHHWTVGCSTYACVKLNAGYSKKETCIKTWNARKFPSELDVKEKLYFLMENCPNDSLGRDAAIHGTYVAILELLEGGRNND